MTEPFACPRRPAWPEPHPGPDTYGPGHGLIGQARGCSYCGSMHPDDFMEAVRDGAEVGPTDKTYKLYLQAGGAAPREGKFYTPHLSDEQGREFFALWAADKINWGYPGYPYARLYLPGLAPVAPEGAPDDAA